MQQDDLWKRFTNSGKIEDYLAYCRVEHTENTVADSKNL